MGLARDISMVKPKKLAAPGAPQGGKATPKGKSLSRKRKKLPKAVEKPVTESPLNLKETLWQLVASIPAGRVATYGQLARLAGYPRHARYVGTTLRHLPKGTALPWFRVLRSSGELAFPPASSAWKRQKALLEDDGVLFKGMKVSLRQYLWDL